MSQVEEWGRSPDFCQNRPTYGPKPKTERFRSIEVIVEKMVFSDKKKAKKCVGWPLKLTMFLFLDVVQSSSSSQPRVEERTAAQLPAQEYTIKCSVCPKVFTRQPYLDRHFAKCHTFKLPHICHTCGNSYEKEHLLITHQETHSGKHECQICHARFAYATGLVHHTKKIHIETCFKCPAPKCGEILASEVLLDHHSNIHSPQMPVECSVCDEAFDHFFALYDHYEVKHRLAKCIYQRSRQDNCKCLHCDKKFPILNYLKFHIVSKTLGAKHNMECKYCHQSAHAKKRK
jgi:Zinc finger, C2H2 type